VDSHAFETIGAGVWVLDARDRTLYVNARLASLLGRVPDEVHGAHFLDFVPDDARADARGLLDGSRLRGGQAELPLHVPDGSHRWVVIAAQPSAAAPDGSPGLTCVVVDITGRKLTEDRLRRVEEHYRVLAEAAEDHIFVIDRDDRVEYVNQAAARQLRTVPDRVIGRQRREIFPPDVAERQGQNLQQVFSTGQAVYAEGRTLYLDREVWLGTWLAPVTGANGDVRAVLGLSRDMTEQKRAQAELFRAQKLEAIGLLAGGIAHDFNNNLTAILGYVELIREQLPDRTFLANELTEVRNAAERAAGLVRRLLAFGRRQVVQPRPLNLNALVEGLVSMFERVIGERIQINVALAPDLWPVSADAGELEQVVMNLALNARDAMPNGGVLTIETANVHASVPRPSTMADGPYVLLSMRDTGAGMAAHVKEHVFEPFFTTKPPGEGTGLGLSTVYAIVKQLQGYIWVESEEGKGAAFNVHLPALPIGAEAAAPVAVPAPAPLPIASRGELILLVEDEHGVRRFAKRALERHGFRVVDAATPEDALAMVSAGEHRPSLLLSDVVMPQMSGPELASRLKAMMPDLIVLYMSGYPKNLVMTDGLVDPSMKLISKPFSAAALSAYVQEALDAR
jgi:PAS domain S-box-containing protein